MKHLLIDHDEYEVIIAFTPEEIDNIRSLQSKLPSGYKEEVTLTQTSDEGEVGYALWKAAGDTRNRRESK